MSVHINHTVSPTITEEEKKYYSRSMQRSAILFAALNCEAARKRSCAAQHWMQFI